jgi:hypothetical protein
MSPNNYILQVLRCFASVDNPTISKQLSGIRGLVRLKLDSNSFIEINESSISINNQNIEEKILCPDKPVLDIVDINNVINFISDIANDITGLNHLGISYSCENIEKELIFYKKLISGTSLKLFEEKSDSKFNRWFFIGNFGNDNNPLFEIVLTESPTSVYNDWIPHFQIDFNTALDYKTIVNKTEFLLAQGFIKWKLDIPNYGIVLSMGFLGNINGTKITLGIGTNLRGKQTLKEVM